jgi:hypothetical protein
MKVISNLDTDDYLIIFLLLIGLLVAVIGIYSVGSMFVDWLSSSLSNINMN